MLPEYVRILDVCGRDVYRSFFSYNICIETK